MTLLSQGYSFEMAFEKAPETAKGVILTPDTYRELTELAKDAKEAADRARLVGQVPHVAGDESARQPPHLGLVPRLVDDHRRDRGLEDPVGHAARRAPEGPQPRPAEG